MNDLISREVNFQGDNLLATQYQDKVYVGVSHICNGIGLTEGQKDRQVKNIQLDYVVSQGCKNLPVKFDGQIRNVLCIELDFLPLWLAKISITPKMIKENPALTNKLAEYQLKAKDVLSQAFFIKDKYYVPKTMSEALMLASNLQKELEEAQPKIQFYNDLANCDDDLFNFSQVADTFGIGRNFLLKELRELKILMDDENYWNIPYSKYIQNGCFSTKITLRKSGNGMHSVCTTLCKPKAFKLIKEVLDKKKNGLLESKAK